jgi:hypothetical protein
VGVVACSDFDQTLHHSAPDDKANLPLSSITTLLAHSHSHSRPQTPLTPTFPATFWPSPALVVSPSSSPPSSYSSTTIRKGLASYQRARCFQSGYLVRVLSSWSFLTLATCSGTVVHSLLSPYGSLLLTRDLIALPPSPTSPSPTQASSVAPMLSMEKLVMHRQVRIAFFYFPLPNFG